MKTMTKHLIFLVTLEVGKYYSIKGNVIRTIV